MPPIPTGALLEDAFLTIARDAGASYEVHLHLQKALAALADTAPEAFAEEAKSVSSDALRRAQEAGLAGAELERLQAAAPGS